MLKFAVAHIDGISAYGNRRVLASEFDGICPVRGGRSAVEQSGLSQLLPPCAQPHTLSPVRESADPVQYRAIVQYACTASATGNQQHIGRSDRADIALGHNADTGRGRKRTGPQANNFDRIRWNARNHVSEQQTRRLAESSSGPAIYRASASGYPSMTTVRVAERDFAECGLTIAFLRAT